MRPHPMSLGTSNEGYRDRNPEGLQTPTRMEPSHSRQTQTKETPMSIHAPPTTVALIRVNLRGDVTA